MNANRLISEYAQMPKSEQDAFDLRYERMKALEKSAALFYSAVCRWCGKSFLNRPGIDSGRCPYCGQSNPKP